MKKFVLITIFFFLLTHSFCFAQCRQFTTKHCLPQLAGYILAGQINSAPLYEGDVAELVLPLVRDNVYRIFICSADNLGKVRFKLLDTERNILFDNSTYNFTEYWDITTNSNRKLIVEVTVPKISATNSIIQKGCVSIVVGYTAINSK